MTRPASRGFTLLEVLVALVVVSIGLLGLLGLQAVSLANTQVSHARSLASVAANNIGERMRANPAGVADNFYSAITHPAGGGASEPEPHCDEAACTPQQMAAWDAYQWDSYLAATLAQGRGRVTCLDAVPSPADSDPCSPNSPHLISIIWTERDRVSDADLANAAAKCANLDGVDDRCFQTTFMP